METGSQYAKVLNSTKTLNIVDVTLVTCRQETKVPYHESSVTIVVLPIDIKFVSIKQEQCELISQSAILQSRHIDVEIQDTKFTSLCATGYYKNIKTYMFSIIPTYITNHGNLSNACFDIQEQTCDNSIAVSSDLTVTMRTEFTQTFHITSNDIIEIEVPHVSILMVFEKHKACLTLMFKYRVALLMLHEVTKTSILENRFQIIVHCALN